MDIEKLAAEYKPNQTVADVIKRSKIVLVAGIVSAGKSTIQNKLVDLSHYYPIITYTTREPRENNGVLEKDGKEYHFATEDQIANLLVNHKMIEINCFSGNYYGTGVQEFLNANSQNKIALANIDVNGVASYEQIAPDCVKAVFVVPPDYGSWIHRFSGRYTSEDEFSKVLQSRLRTAINELEQALNTPYYNFVINDDLDKAVETVDKIVRSEAKGKKYDDSLARDCARRLLESIKKLT